MLIKVVQYIKKNTSKGDGTMETDWLVELMDKYSITIGNTAYPPILFLWVLCFLFIIFIIKIIIFLNIEKKRKRKQKLIMLIGRQGLCYTCAVIVSFSLTCIFANNSNIILNYFICPAAGYLMSIIFEKKLLGPLESAYGVEKKCGSSNSSNNITLNINTDEDDDGDTDDRKKQHNISDYTKKPEKTDYISDTEIQSDECSLIVQGKINELIDYRHMAAVEFENIHEELKTQTEILNAMRETMKDDKKLKLEKMIYECLNQGFATPEQNKIITTDYRNYSALGGNGDIKELYEKHYLKLDVHEDRRKQNH